ncbi:MAG: PadR family transcriptional regulator [Bacteroidetes bacterium]|nr:PadR family transcriptional regulator [Bacteroidota bacterium]MDA0874268.1 PadR family transcriptional regulator [Bacteroidota bacterium]
MLTRAEELILLAVWRLQEEAYGASIRTHLSDVTGEDWPIATVYTPLDRLTRKGLLRSRMGSPTGGRGGRSRKLYQLTADGVRTLGHARNVTEAMWQDLPDLGMSWS